jgi:hypothetical protein
MSVLFHHYRELKECINQVGQLEEARVHNKKIRGLEKKEEEKGEVPTTLDIYFTKRIAER